MKETLEGCKRQLAEAYNTRKRLKDFGMDADASMWNHTIMNLEHQVDYWTREIEKRGSVG